MSDINLKSSKKLYVRLAIRLVLAVAFVLFIIFVFPNLFRILSPFIFALLMALIVNFVVRKINTKISLPTRIASLFLSLLVLIGISTLFAFLVYILVREIIDFSLNIQENWSSIMIQVNGFLRNFDWLVDILPAQVVKFFDGFEETILDYIYDTSGNILESTLSITASVISRTGSFFLRLITFFLAWYFITSDYAYLSRVIQEKLSDRVIENYLLIKNSIVTAFGSYIKAQFTFATIAFVFMLIALTIYGQPYSFLLALFLGLIDLLPLIGTIAILLPWGIFEFLTEDIDKGLFLLILGIVFFLFRRLIEPKVMGNHTGLHPLLALLSIYLGIQILGVWGAILGPIVFMLIISIGRSGIFDNTISDLKEMYNKIALLLNKN